MKFTLSSLLGLSLCHSLASAIPYSHGSTKSVLYPRQNSSTSAFCENTPKSRSCWGDYSIDTDFYDVTPETNQTKEFWLSVIGADVTLDGFTRFALTFNGTIPGPALIANWGDNIVIHVTNNLKENGTAIHWHGIRQGNSTEYDGVPGVTQCPIAPGDTLTYRFRATQYGSTWYHSHFILQYGDGMFGPLIINGPATADYDEDLGALFLSDWGHQTDQSRWDTAKLGAPPTLENALLNGTNTFNCSTTDSSACIGGGKKFQAVFEPGKKYLIRLINSAVDGHFQFSIDGHTLKVIANDLVPIVPYTTNNVTISMAQRYDVIVEANAQPGDYWIRGGWITACATNGNAQDVTGILRYDASSTATPTTTGLVTGDNCSDEPKENLVPHLSMDVGDFTGNDVTNELLSFLGGAAFTWTINTTSLLLDWSKPTTLKIFNNESVFPTPYNVVPLQKSNTEWTVLVIQDRSGLGLTHPIHLHGHDFWVIAQDTGMFDLSTTKLNLKNPPRRDVASLPGNGYLAIAFKKDNPGSWLVHCHIAWHASQGLALQFVERQNEISLTMQDADEFKDTCDKWDAFAPTMKWPQDDSGI